MFSQGRAITGGSLSFCSELYSCKPEIDQDSGVKEFKITMEK